MNRAVWRAAFGTLLGKRRMAYYYLLTAYLTAQWAGISYRRHGAGIAYGMLVVLIAFMWPLAVRKAPAHRELLRLPLSTRDVGSVLFILRVIAPCVCLLLLTPLIAPLSAEVFSPRELLAIAGGLCAAFPLLSVSTFLPLPRSWREYGDTREECAPRLHWLAAAALWLLAPAVAVIPLASLRNDFPDWPWLSLLLGAGLTTLVWMQRERLARAAIRAGSSAPPGSQHEDGARWLGGLGFVPLLMPTVGTACMLAAAVGLFFSMPLLPRAAITVAVIFIALSASISARYILGCVRVLRLLPLGPRRLSVIMLAIVTLPTLLGCLLGVTLAHAMHPERLSIAHSELLCLLSVSCTVLVFAPILRASRVQFQGPLFAAAAALQVAVALAALHFGISLPPDGWLALACFASLGVCLAWLHANVKRYALR